MDQVKNKLVVVLVVLVVLGGGGFFTEHTQVTPGLPMLQDFCWCNIFTCSYIFHKIVHCPQDYSSV